MLRIEKDRQTDKVVVFHQFVKSLGAVKQTPQDWHSVTGQKDELGSLIKFFTNQFSILW